MNGRATIFLAVIGAIFVSFGELTGGIDGAMWSLIVALALALYAVARVGDQLVANAEALASPEAPPRAVAVLVQDIAFRMDVPMPRIGLVESESLNALTAEGYKRGVFLLLTTALVDKMPRDELAAVVAHELAHVQRRDTVAGLIGLRLAETIIAMGSIIALFGAALGRRGGGAFIALGVTAPVAAILLRLAMDRSAEYGADLMAAHTVGLGPMIAVLERLERDATTAGPLSLGTVAALAFAPSHSNGGFASFFSAHPTLRRRIERLRRRQEEARLGTA